MASETTLGGSARSLPVNISAYRRVASRSGERTPISSRVRSPIRCDVFCMVTTPGSLLGNSSEKAVRSSRRLAMATEAANTRVATASTRRARRPMNRQ